jgi:RNA polymerase sigma factor (sigma-70 family)
MRGMMTTKSMSVSAQDDTDLVAASLAGNRDAFGQIVARYQSLICSLAYSATGSLSHSEDLAQETFLTAWKSLGGLREPAKLRSWLCSIARNLIHNWLRKQGREPSHGAETLETIHESPAPLPPPHDEAMSNEELAILWRSLERIPETYREPLVLFYREHKSIKDVAQALDLTEETTRQRLLRGRRLLHDEVLAFVESALQRTNPGRAFTLGVLAALPLTFATSAKAATLGVAAAKGGATATGASFLAVLAALCGPALGLLGGYLGVKASLNQSRTPRERAFVIRRTKIVALGMATFMMALLSFIYFGRALWKQHPAILIVGGVAITAGYAALIFCIAWKFNRDHARLRDEERQLNPEAFRDDPLPLVWEYRSRATLFGFPLIHCRWGRRPGQPMQPAIGWIACGDKAYGILFASGAIAVGGISFGGLSVGLISFGGISVGVLTFGGLALGALAMGGAAIGIVASGGIAVAWHAAIGGIAAARELALGGATLAPHTNDSVALEFFARSPYHWLDITQPGPRNAFWTISFAPMLLQLLIANWWRRKRAKCLQ